jgi:hypothetical protein
VLTNVTIFGNEASGHDGGGGISNGNNCSPVLTNVTISGNHSDDHGGGISNRNYSSPVLTNVTISGNRSGNHGGGIYNTYSSPVLTNVTISGNEAGLGGGINNDFNSSPVLTNVTISGNHSANEGGGIYNYYNSSPVIRNSIIWGNTAFGAANIYNDTSTPLFAFSLVEGSGGGAWNNLLGLEEPTGGVGSNWDVNPQFASPATAPVPTATGDYSLQSGSPAKDIGNDSFYLDTWFKWSTDLYIDPVLQAAPFDGIYNTYILPYINKDLAGNPRLNGVIDMGAYEKQ